MWWITGMRRRRLRISSMPSSPGPKRTIDRMIRGAMGPLLSAATLFALPLVGALVLPVEEFAFWSLLASLSAVALSVDFGGTAWLSARYHFASRTSVHLQAWGLSVAGSAIVGGVALLAWLPVAHAQFARTISFDAGAWAIVAMSAAAAVRSVLLVVAQSSLIEGWLALRNVATAGHAALATLVTLVWLWVDVSYWALPMGWLVSGLLLTPACLAWFVRRSRTTVHVIRGTNRLSWAAYAGLRTLNTVAASLVLQADRWIVASLGGPAWLALYEVAWRFATLPRMLIQALAAHISADVAPMVRGQAGDLMNTVRRSTVVLAIVGIISAPVVGFAYFAFTMISGHGYDLRVFIPMVLAFIALALTSPLSIAGMSVGRPAIDLPYALVALGGTGVAALLGFASGNVWVFTVGYVLALMVSVPVFFAYAPSSARKGLDRRLGNDPLAD